MIGLYPGPISANQLTLLKSIHLPTIKLPTCKFINLPIYPPINLLAYYSTELPAYFPIDVCVKKPKYQTTNLAMSHVGDLSA